jgi:hypothetical protein
MTRAFDPAVGEPAASGQCYASEHQRLGARPQSRYRVNMQKHITRDIEATADAQLSSATDAVAAAIQFVRSVAEDHTAVRAKSPLESRFGAEKIAAVVDDAITTVAENSMAEYVRQIVRGAGPPERQQFSLGNQLTWNPGRALPQFLYQGKPILLTDPEQVARWDRLAKQEARENASGPMAQIFKAQRKPAPPDIAAELQRSAEGKITFRSADRPGWDKVIYYHAGEKGAAARLADILGNYRELTEEQQAEVWRLEGWPEADIGRELERMRNVQRMHDESWWNPPASLTERAHQYAKNLLSLGRPKKIARTSPKAEPELTQRLRREIQQSPEQIAALPKSPPFNVGKHAEPEHNGIKADRALPKAVLEPSTIMDFHQADVHAAVGPDLNHARANGDVRSSAGTARKDEPVFRWLDTAMEDVHRYAQSQRPISMRRR